jgi:hypothetical protein
MVVYAFEDSRIADGNWFGSTTTPKECCRAKPPDADERCKVKSGKTELPDSVIKSTFNSYSVGINARQNIVIDVSQLPKQNPPGNE